MGLPEGTAPGIGRDRVALAALGALGAWTFVPIAVLVAHAGVHGGVFTGVTGLDPYDQYQYLAWIRDSGEHVLAANLFGVIGGHVFAQPMYLLSGLLWHLGLSLQLSYLLWAPVAVGLVWVGFSAYARRMGSSAARRAAILFLGLFFATPIGWGSLPNTHWVGEMQLDMTDGVVALQTWFALPAAIAIGLFPLVLLGCERIIVARQAISLRSPLVIVTTIGAALVAWLHSWQGATLLLVMLGVWAIRRPRRSDLVLALPVVGCALPLAYQVILSKVDAAWELAAQTNHRPDLVVLTPPLAVLGPLVLAAVVGVIRRRPRGDGEWMLVLWPLAALIVYRFDPEFPPHAFQGVTLPLAALAVRGWPRQRAGSAFGAVGILLFTAPGLAYFAKALPSAVAGNRSLFFLSPDDHAAMQFLARARAPGPVLAPMPLAMAVPAFTDRAVWVGHQIWTPDQAARQAQAGALYAGAMAPSKAQAFLRQTRVRWVLADCASSTRVIAQVSSTIATVHRFGCVTLILIGDRRSRSPG